MSEQINGKTYLNALLEGLTDEHVFAPNEVETVLQTSSDTGRVVDHLKKISAEGHAIKGKHVGRNKKREVNAKWKQDQLEKARDWQTLELGNLHAHLAELVEIMKACDENKQEYPEFAAYDVYSLNGVNFCEKHGIKFNNKYLEEKLKTEERKMQQQLARQEGVVQEGNRKSRQIVIQCCKSFIQALDTMKATMSVENFYFILSLYIEANFHINDFSAFDDSLDEIIEKLCSMSIGQIECVDGYFIFGGLDYVRKGTKYFELLQKFFYVDLFDGHDCLVFKYKDFKYWITGRDKYVHYQYVSQNLDKNKVNGRFYMLHDIAQNSHVVHNMLYARSFLNDLYDENWEELHVNNLNAVINNVEDNSTRLSYSNVLENLKQFLGLAMFKIRVTDVTPKPCNQTSSLLCSAVTGSNYGSTTVVSCEVAKDAYKLNDEDDDSDLIPNTNEKKEREFADASPLSKKEKCDIIKQSRIKRATKSNRDKEGQRKGMVNRKMDFEDDDSYVFTEQISYSVTGSDIVDSARNLIENILENCAGDILIDSPPLFMLDFLNNIADSHRIVVCYDNQLTHYDCVRFDDNICHCGKGIECNQIKYDTNVVSFYGAMVKDVVCKGKNLFYVGPHFIHPQGRGKLFNWKCARVGVDLILSVSNEEGTYNTNYMLMEHLRLSSQRRCIYKSFGREVIMRITYNADAVPYSQGPLSLVEGKSNPIPTIFPVAPTDRYANYNVFDGNILDNASIYETVKSVMLNKVDCDLVVIPKTLIVELASRSVYSLRDRTLLLSLKAKCLQIAIGHGVCAEDLDIVSIYAVKLAMFKNITLEATSVTDLTYKKNSWDNKVFAKNADLPENEAMAAADTIQSLLRTDFNVLKEFWLTLVWIYELICLVIHQWKDGYPIRKIIDENYPLVKSYFLDDRAPVIPRKLPLASMNVLRQKATYSALLLMLAQYKYFPKLFWIKLLGTAIGLVDNFNGWIAAVIVAPILEELYKDIFGWTFFAIYEALAKRREGFAWRILALPFMIHAMNGLMSYDLFTRIFIHMSYNFTVVCIAKGYSGMLKFNDFYSDAPKPVEMEKVLKNAKISHPKLEKGFERNLIPSITKLGVQIGPVYCSRPAVVRNDVTSLLSGIIRQAEAGVVDNLEMESFEKFYIKNFIPFIRSSLGIVEYYSDEEFLTFQPSDKCKQYLLAIKESEVDDITDFKEWERYRISTFTKVEWTVPEFKNGILEKRPRIISNWHKYLGFKSGKFFVPLSKMMNKVFNHEHNLFYCSATTPVIVGNYISQSPNFIDNDCSKWDGHVVAKMKELELKLWRALGMDPESEYYYKMLLDFDTKVMMTDALDAYSMRIRIPGTRYSGSPETSLGNSLLNMSLHLYALMKVFKFGNLYDTIAKVKMVVLGDDINIGLYDDITDEHLKGVETIIRNLGHVPKVERRVLNTVEFCSQHVHPVLEGYSLLPKLGKLMQRSSWHRVPSLDVSAEERIGRYKADLMGRVHVFSQMPFVRVIFKYYQENYTDVSLVYDKWQQPFIHYNPHKITFTEETNHSIMDKYGINMSDVESLEKEMVVTPDHMEIHPVIQCIVDKDNGFEGQDLSDCRPLGNVLKKDRLDEHFLYKGLAAFKLNARQGVRKTIFKFSLVFFLIILVGSFCFDNEMVRKYRNRKATFKTSLVKRVAVERGGKPNVPKMPLDLDDSDRVKITSIKRRSQKRHVKNRGRTNKGNYRMGRTAIGDVSLVDSTTGENSKKCAVGQLQPWYAMKAGMSVPHPQEVTEQPYWRHSTTTKMTYNYGTSLGGIYWGNLSITKNPAALIEYATSFNIDGSAAAYLTVPDVGYSTYSTIFETMTVVAQELRVRQIGIMSDLSGESVMGWQVYKSRNMSYEAAKTINTRITHADNIPGDIVRLQANFVTDQRPATDDTVMDLLYGEPGWVCDPNSSIIYWSASSGAQPQSIDIEVITHYASRPFAGVTNIYYPTPCPVDPALVNATETGMLAKQGNFTIDRCVVKDDGVIESIVKDVRGVVGGVSQIYSGVKGLFNTFSSLFSKDFKDLHPMEKLNRILIHHGEKDFNELIDLFASVNNKHKTFKDLYAEWKRQQQWEKAKDSVMVQHILELEKQLSLLTKQRIVVCEEEKDETDSLASYRSSTSTGRKRN